MLADEELDSRLVASNVKKRENSHTDSAIFRSGRRSDSYSEEKSSHQSRGRSFSPRETSEDRDDKGTIVYIHFEEK